MALPHRLGVAPGVASPIRLSETAVDYRAAPPLLGEHTRLVLGELLDIDVAELDELVGKEIIK